MQTIGGLRPERHKHYETTEPITVEPASSSNIQSSLTDENRFLLDQTSKNNQLILLKPIKIMFSTLPVNTLKIIMGLL